MKKIISIFASFLPNFLKIPLYRLIGYRIGKKVKIKFMTLILADKVNIGDNVRIGALNVFKMKELSIGENSTIRSLNMAIGRKKLKIGNRVQIVGPFTFMNLAEDIELDDGCGIGSHSIFYTHGVYLPYTEGNPRKFAKIYLGKKVWSPTNITFLPGVSIGDNSIISAGSVINRSFPEDSFISGSPAKRITKASNFKKEMNEKMLQERLKEIIFDFSKDPFFEGFKITLGKSEFLAENKKGKRLFVKLNDGKVSLKDYDEVVIFGENVKLVGIKGLSLFDLRKRKMILGGRLGKEFLNHLETYGEYFNEY